MQRVFAMLDRVIDTSVPVLVTGESGTGKELVARAIHANGMQKDGSLVSVNCGALPETLLESELFGHVRGSFTGADRDRAVGASPVPGCPGTRGTKGLPEWASRPRREGASAFCFS